MTSNSWKATFQKDGAARDYSSYNLNPYSFDAEVSMDLWRYGADPALSDFRDRVKALVEEAGGVFSDRRLRFIEAGYLPIRDAMLVRVQYDPY